MFGSEAALHLFIVHVIVMAIMVSSKTSHLGDIFSTRFSILVLYVHGVKAISFWLVLDTRVEYVKCAELIFAKSNV